MQAERLIAMLESFPPMLRAAVGGLSLADYRSKPASGAWSILEILCHLADEETSDFRPRVLNTLDDPSKPWEPIDPEGWTGDRKYNEQDPLEQLERFRTSRAESLKLLRELRDPDWNAAYEHPKFGPIRAGDVMVSWVTHDMLHLRQIAKRRYELAQKAGEGFSTEYAGDW